LRSTVPACSIEFVGISVSGRTAAKPPARGSEQTINRLVISPGGKAMFSNGHLREISLARARIGDRELAALEPLPAREALNLEATDSSPRFAT
jgi:hypothetical protein